MTEHLLVDAFCQADMVRGWRYLDDAGRIMNKWDSAFPEKTVGLDGLMMRNRDAVFETLKVNPLIVWLHFSLPEKLDDVISTSEATIEGVSEILGVSQYRRIGVRVQYLHGIDRDKLGQAVQQMAQNLFSSKWAADPAIPIISPFNFEFMVKVANEPIEVNLRVGTVSILPESRHKKNLPETGTLIDLDLYHRRIIHIADLRGFMKRVKDWLSGELPHIENRVFGGVNFE